MGLGVLAPAHFRDPPPCNTIHHAGWDDEDPREGRCHAPMKDGTGTEAPGRSSTSVGRGSLERLRPRSSLRRLERGHFDRGGLAGHAGGGSASGKSIPIFLDAIASIPAATSVLHAAASCRGAVASVGRRTPEPLFRRASLPEWQRRPRQLVGFGGGEARRDVRNSLHEGGSAMS